MNRRTMLAALFGLPAADFITNCTVVGSGAAFIEKATSINAPTFLRNCHLKSRDDDSGPMFYGSDEHGIQARLDGYAIIPKDEYYRLIGKL